ncbi:MAG: hypothetical protein M3Z13_05745 [Candidatus Dormibacteraeota bacterium]|nr:hypothetical protein [Candidatus Dormibacteraeota bacterium]
MNLAVVGVTFLAAAVEWVEALTIVLAVGAIKGWRSALTGTGIAVASLIAIVAAVVIFGTQITRLVPIAVPRTLVGVFLLLFGLKWLHKAILRSAGLKALHDEAKAFAETEDELRSAKSHWAGVATSFNGVFLEGVEVVFIVVALGGLNSLQAAAIGAVTSMLAVVVIGVALRHPLTRVPENAMKYVVGIMLTSFGTFFAGEGIGVQWWRDDLVLIPLILAYGVASLLLVMYLRRPVRPRGERSTAVRVMRAILSELWGLFVDDGALAIFTVAALLAVALFATLVSSQRRLAGLLLVLGVMAAVIVGLAGPARKRAQAARETSELQA